MPASPTLSQILADVAREVFQGASAVNTPSGQARVTRTSRQGLRRLEFVIEGRRIVAIEQNPATGSRWAQLAREGHQVMQFKDAVTNRYIGNVVDGHVTLYGSSAGPPAKKMKPD